MKISILGSGAVGQTLGKSLSDSGHEVVIGTRTPASLDEKRGYAASLKDWLASLTRRASVATFAESAAHGEVVINATSGRGSIEALNHAGAMNLDGKILIDVSNPLDFSKGMTPSLTICNTDSLGELIQRSVPGAKVVKTLNTVTAELMVAPHKVAQGNHGLFVCGNDESARKQVAVWLNEWFGWKPEQIVDLGDITAARGTEMYLPLWVRLYGQLGTSMFGISIVR